MTRHLETGTTAGWGVTGLPRSWDDPEVPTWAGVLCAVVAVLVVVVLTDRAGLALHKREEEQAARAREEARRHQVSPPERPSLSPGQDASLIVGVLWTLGVFAVVGTTIVRLILS